MSDNKANLHTNGKLFSCDASVGASRWRFCDCGVRYTRSSGIKQQPASVVSGTALPVFSRASMTNRSDYICNRNGEHYETLGSETTHSH